LVRNAPLTAVTLPATSSSSPFGSTRVIFSPCDSSQLSTACISAGAIPNMLPTCVGVSHWWYSADPGVCCSANNCSNAACVAGSRFSATVTFSGALTGTTAAAVFSARTHPGRCPPSRTFALKSGFAATRRAGRGRNAASASEAFSVDAVDCAAVDCAPEEGTVVRTTAATSKNRPRFRRGPERRNRKRGLVFQLSFWAWTSLGISTLLTHKGHIMRPLGKPPRYVGEKQGYFRVRAHQSHSGCSIGRNHQDHQLAGHFLARGRTPCILILNQG